MKLHGSGRILLVWVSSVAGLFRSGNVRPVTGSTTPAKGRGGTVAQDALEGRQRRQGTFGPRQQSENQERNERSLQSRNTLAVH